MLVNQRLCNSLLLGSEFLEVRSPELVDEDFNLRGAGNIDRFTDISQSIECIRLVRSSMAPFRYLITHPSLHLYIQIPNPQNPSLCIALDIFKSNLLAKVLSVHENNINQSLGYEILNVGIDTSTYSWRAIEVDNLQNNNTNNITNKIRKSIQIFFRNGVAYCIWFVESSVDDDDDDIEVDILDMQDNGSYIGHTTFPKGFFPKLKSVHLLDWNGQLSFAEIVMDELHVLVLEDHKTKRWAESKIIRQLPCHVNFKDKVVCAHKSSLFFGGENELDVNVCAHKSTLEFVMENKLGNNKSRYQGSMISLKAR